MKYMAALIALVAIVAVVVCWPSRHTDDMEQVMEDAMVAGVEAIEATVQIDLAEFEVRIESNEEDENYYRRDQLVLSRWRDKPVFTLYKEGVAFGNVVVGKDYSPHIVLHSNLEFSVSLIALEEGAWELTAYGADSEFPEAYIVASESVQPVSAETYLLKLAEAQGSRAFFKSMGDSMLGVLESGEADETE